MRATSWVMLAAVGLVAAIATPAGATTSAHHRFRVRPGQSIQSVVDQASAGDEVDVAPGTYRQTVTIGKSITLNGDRAVLVAPVATSTACDVSGTDLPWPGRHFGVCIVNASNVRVSGFEIDGFDGAGVIVLFSDHVDVFRNTLAHDAGAGVYVGFLGEHVTVRWNSAHDDGDGIAVDFGPGNVSVTDNRAFKNTESGVSVTDAEGPGNVARNDISGSCIGLFAGAENGGIDTWSFTFNRVHDNHGLCGGDTASAPGESGSGVVATGNVNDSSFRNNEITGNSWNGTTRGTGGGFVLTPIADDDLFPAGNVVSANVVRGNAPVDLRATGLTTTNTLRPNSCGTSLPAGLC
jgi:hypothetical protein